MKRDLLGKGTRHGSLLDDDGRDGPVDHDGQHGEFESNGSGRERHLVCLFVWVGVVGLCVFGRGFGARYTKFL